MARRKPRIDVLKEIAAKMVSDLMARVPVSVVGTEAIRPQVEAYMVQMGIRAWEAAERRMRARSCRCFRCELPRRVV